MYFGSQNIYTHLIRTLPSQKIFIQICKIGNIKDYQLKIFFLKNMYFGQGTNGMKENILCSY